MKSLYGKVYTTMVAIHLLEICIECITNDLNRVKVHCAVYHSCFKLIIAMINEYITILLYLLYKLINNKLFAV